MAWQTTTETGRIIAIAYGAENLAIPSTKPLTGASFDWTDNASGGATFGWTAIDAKFAEDDFDFADNEGNPITVFPPTAAQKSAIIRDEAQVPSQITFTSYEVGSKMYTAATNATEATGLFSITAAHTVRRSLIIEIEGLGLHYMPSTEITVGTAGGGVKTLATQAGVIDIFAGSSVTTGYQFLQYQDS